MVVDPVAAQIGEDERRGARVILVVFELSVGQEVEDREGVVEAGHAVKAKTVVIILRGQI